MDVYDLVGSDLVEQDDEVWIEISIGGTTSGEHSFSWRRKKQCFVYKPIQVVDEALVNIALPRDISQIPDIFLDLYTSTTFKDKVRIGYLRMPVENCLSVKPKPNWFRLSSPYNDLDGLTPGVLLTNVQFLRYDAEQPNNPERIKKEKFGKVKFYFYY